MLSEPSSPQHARFPPSLIHRPSVWRAVIGYEGLYAVSSRGKVWAASRYRTNGHYSYWTKPQLKTRRLDRDGYNKVDLTINGSTRCFRVARLVATAFVPNHDGLPEVNHKNGDKSDDRAVDLEWCTRGQNNFHACRTLKVRVGEKSHLSKLRDGQLPKIRELLKRKFSDSWIASRFKVHRVTISRIRRKKIWVSV